MIFHFLYFFIFLQDSRGNIQKHLPLTSNEILYSLIDKWLEYPLNDLPHLHLQLCVDNLKENIENSYTQWFLKQTKLPITLSTYEQLNLSIPRMDPKADNNREIYVIVTVMDNLRLAARQFAQRAGVFFFIVIGDPDIEEMRDVFNIMWTRYLVFKNFLLTMDGVLVYDPFALNDYNVYGKIVQYRGENSLERVIFANMRGYPLRAQIFDSVFAHLESDAETNGVKNARGVDGRVASLLKDHFNFTFILQDPDPNYFGERFPNGTYNGAIGSIINNQVDICLNGFFVKDYLTDEIEFSVAVYDDKLCIYTPKAKLISKFALPIFSVDYGIWLCFILMGFLCSVIWSILRRLNLWLDISDIKYKKHLYLNKDIKWQYVDILNDTWVAWVRVVLVRFPPFSSERVFVASISFASVIFGAIFESSLATVFIYPMHFKDLYNLQELDDSGLLMFYKHASMADDLFLGETSSLFHSLNKKLVHVKNHSYDLQHDVAYNGGKAGVTRYNALMMEFSSLVVSKNIWIVPEYPKYYSISYVWKRDAPWEETFNQALLLFLSNGFIHKFIRDMQAEVVTKIMIEQLHQSYAPFRVLTFEDLQLAFSVVLIGNILAAICLIVEKILPLYYNRKK